MNPARALIAVGVAVVLAAVNLSILGKEAIKRDGAVVYLDLQPVDPRSIMQGDYMTLRFRLAQDIENRDRSQMREGEVRMADVLLDEQRVGRLAQAGAAPTLRIRYRVRKGRVWLGTNAFFFEEGSESRYAPARYGEFRVDAASGEAVLVGLRDAKLKAL